MRLSFVLRFAGRAALAATCTLAACAAETGATPETDPDAVSFAATVQPLVNQACNCHQSTPVLMAPFSLKPGEAHANMVERPSMQLPSMLLVKPGALNESYLWHKINGTQLEVGGVGMIMPYTVPLVAAELAVFERWIAAGAAP
jgi:hypothetical protein